MLRKNEGQAALRRPVSSENNQLPSFAAPLRLCSAPVHRSVPTTYKNKLGQTERFILMIVKVC